MFWGLIGAAGAALAYGFASILQALGVRGRPWLYGVGLGLDGVGFLTSLAALHTLPLFVVQSTIAASVVVTALAAVPLMGAVLGPRERLALALVAGGLIALAASADPGVATPLTDTAAWWLVGLMLPVAVLGAVALRVPGARGGVLMAAVAGLCFAGTGVAARELTIPHPWWHLLGQHQVWALAGYGAISLVAFGVALTRAPVTTVAAVTFVVETIIPAVVGVAWLGDAVRSGWWPAMVLGMLGSLVGCLLLARFADPAEIEAR